MEMDRIRETSKRIGLMIPSSNTVMEPEFYQMSPSGVTIHTARLMLVQVEYAAWMEMNQDIERAARYLATAEVDFIVFGCTGASFAKGMGYDKEILAQIRGVTDIPAVTTSTAVLDAFERLGLGKICMATPYTTKSNQIAEEFFRGNGYEIVATSGLGILKNTDIGRLPSLTAYQLAKDVDTPKADGVFISCTNWRTIDILDKLEAELKKPVVSSTQVSMWSTLYRMGLCTPVEGYGSLLKNL